MQLTYHKENLPSHTAPPARTNPSLDMSFLKTKESSSCIVKFSLHLYSPANMPVRTSAMPLWDVNISPWKTEQTNLDWSQHTPHWLKWWQLLRTTDPGYICNKETARPSTKLQGCPFHPTVPLLLVLYRLPQCKLAERRFNGWSESLRSP